MDETNEEITKLRNIIRLLYKEKQDLKDLVKETPVDNQLNDHIQILQQENENIKNQLNDISVLLRNAKMDLHDTSLKLLVSQKEIKQCKLTVSSLEEDLNKADSDRLTLSKQKIIISEQDDEIRQKNRRIKELETSLQWKEKEIQRLSEKIEPVYIFLFSRKHQINMLCFFTNSPTSSENLYLRPLGLMLSLYLSSVICKREGSN
jgi:chromosome segregation ATPase